MSETKLTPPVFLREAATLAKITLPKVWLAFVGYAFLSMLVTFVLRSIPQTAEPIMVAASGLNFLLSLFIIYFALTKVLQQYKPSFMYPVSFGGFCAWLLASLKKYIVLLLPLFAASLASGFVRKSTLESEPVDIVSMAITFAGMAWLAIASFRLILVSPMALMRNRPLLKNSWGLTRHHFWPIVGAEMLFWFISLGLFLPISAAQDFLAKTHIAFLPFFMIVLILIQFALMLLMMLFSASLTCAIYRLLAQRATDHAVPNPN